MSSPTTATTDRPTRRNTELVLMVFAVVVSMFAYAELALTKDGGLPTDFYTDGLGLVALAVVTHLVVRRFTPYADPLILPCVVLLNGIGLVVIKRLDYPDPRCVPSATRHCTGTSNAQMQFIWMALAIVLFLGVILLIRDHRILQRYTYTAMAAGLFLLILPNLLPASISEVNGAKNWIRLGGFSIQPGEFAKILLVIFFASYFERKRDVLAVASRRVLGLYLPRGRDFGPVIVAWLISVAVLVGSNDLGLSVLFFGVFIALLYVATERISWVLIGLGLSAVGLFFAYQFFGHVKQRFDIWLHPFPVSDRSYQLTSGLFGLANGGVSGTGLGKGYPYLTPFANTDFVLASIGEELGLATVMAIVVLFGVIVSRGFRSAIAVRDNFGKLLAAGLSFSLGLQVFVIVGGVTRLIPLTGVTLPFVSYGGSSLVANWALIALLLRVSDAARRPQAAPPPPSFPDQEKTQVVRI